MKGRDRNKGRRLLALGNLISAETDPSRRRKLRKEEVQVLAKLGNLKAATAAASRLMDDYPDWAGAFSVAADLACRRRDWTEAERLFSRSVDISLSSGDREAAVRIATGPYFRLAEARNAGDVCLELCSALDPLSQVLTARTRRRMGLGFELPKEPEGFPASMIHLLETAWGGGRTAELPGVVSDWSGPEPEWRWRFIVEGVELTSTAGIHTRVWLPAFSASPETVLDPRFGKEKADLSRMFSQGS